MTTLPDMLAWLERERSVAEAYAKCGRLEGWPAASIDRHEGRATMLRAIGEQLRQNEVAA